MRVSDWMIAVFYGIVEGITEWLPVSSTGHLILVEDLLPFRFSTDPVFRSEFFEMFLVVIQLGAIFAVPVLYRERLFPRPSAARGERNRIFCLWGKVLAASLPAAVAGLVGDRMLEKTTGKDLDAWLYRPAVVAAMLVLYGVAFLLLEKRSTLPKSDTVDAVSVKTAFLIGCFQVLALIPGTSRSGATILGAMLLGLSRIAGAEFSFFMAIPVMVGAGGVKILHFVRYVSETRTVVFPDAWILLAIGCAVSFFVSLCAIRFLTDFVKRHSFAPFGWYRVVLGAVILFWMSVR